MQNYVSRYHRVFLVDDHQIVRSGLRDLLSAARDIEVVGESGSATEAVARILESEADVMLLDLHLQDGNGIEVCRSVRSVDPSVQALMLTSAGDDEALAAALLAGAAGYLVKLTRTSDIVGAIRRLGEGRSLLHASEKERATALLDRALGALRPAVTERDRAVLAAIVGGETDSEIADRLAVDGGEHESIARLVTRLTQVLLDPDSGPARCGPGRHRRPD